MALWSSHSYSSKLAKQELFSDVSGFQAGTELKRFLSITEGHVLISMQNLCHRQFVELFCFFWTRLGSELKRSVSGN